MIWSRSEDVVVGAKRERAAPRRKNLHHAGLVVWRRRRQPVGLKDGALLPGVEPHVVPRGGRLGGDVHGDGLPAGAGAVPAEDPPALPEGACGRLPAAAVIPVVPRIQDDDAVDATAIALVVLPSGRRRLVTGEQPGAAVPTGLRRRRGAAALACRRVHGSDGQLARRVVRMDRGGAVLDGVRGVEVALGREDVELPLGAARAPGGSRGLQVAGEEDRPRRRHSVAVHVCNTGGEIRRHLWVTRSVCARELAERGRLSGGICRGGSAGRAKARQAG
uniref:Uncharacterized protein n=1 Tax=Triticum urartu TaxID=4572 RepID=A0A8R7TVJ1_TRIUA